MAADCYFFYNSTNVSFCFWGLLSKVTEMICGHYTIDGHRCLSSFSKDHTLWDFHENLVASHQTRPDISRVYNALQKQQFYKSAIGIATDNEKSPMRRIYWYILRSPLEEVHLVYQCVQMQLNYRRPMYLWTQCYFIVLVEISSPHSCQDTLSLWVRGKSNLDYHWISHVVYCCSYRVR